MADEMCNFYMMYWYDPKENDMEGSPEERCGYVNERGLQFPIDSDVRLPGSGEKMEMKRDSLEGRHSEMHWILLDIGLSSSFLKILLFLAVAFIWDCSILWSDKLLNVYSISNVPEMWCKIVRSVECHWWILFVLLFPPQKTIVLQN